ncbi:MAG: hypothetical protein ABJP45_03195 [Cyclobacteriaceae bacterium]
MRRISFLFLFVSAPIFLFCQASIYQFRDLEVGNHIPSDLNSTRTAVFIDMAPTKTSFLVEGDWKGFSGEVHQYLYKMGIDVVMYINNNDFLAGNSSRNFYQNTLTSRNISNLIFVTKTHSKIEMLCSPYNGEASLVANNQKVYHKNSPSLNRLMLDFGREVKRAENEMQNFLIPNKPTFLDALAIVQNSNLKNYPGQIRRSKLAVEKFATISPVSSASDEVTSRINRYNQQVEAKNKELEELLKDLPYEIEFVDYMSDEDLLRRRYQFTLRNIYASGESIKAMLKYNDAPSDAGYVSLIPVMPDNTTIKTFSRKTLLHKFYIRQNIAKNVYVGEWDADETWQDALTNYIGNMIQFFNKGN